MAVHIALCILMFSPSQHCDHLTSVAAQSCFALYLFHLVYLIIHVNFSYIFSVYKRAAADIEGEVDAIEHVSQGSNSVVFLCCLFLVSEFR